MPTLSNSKHETFASGIANGMNTLDAYEHAGYNRSPSAAAQVKKRPEVNDRINELLQQKMDKAHKEGDTIDNLPSELNRDWLIKTLMTNIQLAQTERQISSANKAIEMLAELIGYSTKPGKGIPPSENTVEDEKLDDSFDLQHMANGMKNLGKMLQDRDNKKASNSSEETK